MSRIYIPTNGPADWKRFLAKPDKQWRQGHSAMTLAACWESANGLPPEIAQILSTIGPEPELQLAIPEHKVPLPGSNRGDSQNDIFILAKAGNKTIAATIEGKVDEPFGSPLGEWLENESVGKRERLSYLCSVLGLKEPLPNDIHYQLIHRAASAIIEARRFKTDAACMLVHSFSAKGKWFDAFERFAELYKQKASKGILLPAESRGAPPLFIGWVVGDQCFRKTRV